MDGNIYKSFWRSDRMKTYADYRWWILKKKIPNIDKIIDDINRTTTFPERASMIVILSQKLKLRPEDIVSVEKLVFKERSDHRCITREMEKQMEDDK